MNDDKPPWLEQELWRANTYQLLAKLLTKLPDHRLIAQLGDIPPASLKNQKDSVALAWCRLGEAARQHKETDLITEYDALFNENAGGLVPRASYYLESLPSFKYLGLLRVELAGLGIERNAEVLEDHAGFLCEIMCLLIEAEDPRQIGFFSRHLKSWLPLFSMI